jgi:uncharacterized protein YpmB
MSFREEFRVNVKEIRIVAMGVTEVRPIKEVEDIKKEDRKGFSYWREYSLPKVLKRKILIA